MLDQLWLMWQSLQPLTYVKCSGTEQEVIQCELKDYPVLLKICKCESGCRHTIKGKVIKGKVHPADSGLMQINTEAHADVLKKMNLDADKLEDNIAFAKFLYERDGLKPWKSSKSCWDK
jgi:hypothetical protein